MSPMMRVYQFCNKLPLGKTIFSRLICWKAPYFSTIKPRFVELRPGYSEIRFKKRRAVTNHIKSVHAIAMCNVSELAAGTALETVVPRTIRWIPKEMTVYYLKIARSNLTAVCEIDSGELDQPGDLPVTVHVRDVKGAEVFRAVITMHLSAKN